MYSMLYLHLHIHFNTVDCVADAQTDLDLCQQISTILHDGSCLVIKGQYFNCTIHCLSKNEVVEDFSNNSTCSWLVNC